MYTTNSLSLRGVRLFLMIFSLFLTITLIGCDGKDDSSQSDKLNQQTPAPANTENSADATDLTDWQIKHGIGPITEELKLGPVDKKMAFKGKDIFESKCASCHKLDERYVGPAQRDLMERRTPEYILNMILNPDEMLKRNPEARKMLAQYMTPMTNQNLSMEDALAVLEYFRLVDLAKK